MADINAGMDTSEFDKHFAELSKLGDASDTAKSTQEPPADVPADPPPSDEPPKAVETPVEGAVDEENPSADDADTGGEPPAPVEDEGAAKKPAADEDTLKRFADYMERQEAERQRAEDARLQQEQGQQEPQAPSQDLSITPQEVETLQIFERDWPEAADAMKIALRINTQAAVQSVFSTLEQYLGPKMHLLDLLANRMQYRELREDFPQYNEDYREQLKSWALSDEHPAYLRAAHEHVIKNGSQQDVADLIERYEQARGQVTTPAATLKPRKTPELPTTTIQAARSMAPVSGKRSNPTVQVTPSSFEDAFDQFAKEPD